MGDETVIDVVSSTEEVHTPVMSETTSDVEVSETVDQSAPIGFIEAEAPLSTIEIDGQIVPAGDGSNMELRRMALQVKSTLEGHQLLFAETLHQIQAQSIFLGWGYASFSEYVQNELEIEERQASNLVKVWDYFGRLDTEILEVIKILGPSKANLLVGKINAENFSKHEEFLRSKPSLRAIAQRFQPDTALAKSNKEGQKNDLGAKISVACTPEEKKLIDDAVATARESGINAPGAALASISAHFLSSESGVSVLDNLKAAILTAGESLQTPQAAMMLADILGSVGVRILVLSPAAEVIAGRQHLNEDGSVKVVD